MDKPLGEFSTSADKARVKGAPKSEGAIRTARLLTAFTQERNTMTAKDLAAAAGIPLPSVYRYIATLREAALLVGDAQGGYHLSAQFVTLARAAEAAESIIDVADPRMRALNAETGETVALVRVVNGSPTCVHRVESTHSLRISLEPGQPLSFEYGASARILLASMDPERRVQHLEALRERDPERARILDREVGLAARRRWATSEQELDPGIWAAAAAIDCANRMVAVLSVPSPLIRATQPVRARILDQVRQSAASISMALHAHAVST